MKRIPYPIKLAIIAVVFLAVGFFLSGGPSFFAARSQAYREFVQSRAGQTDSYEFLSRGLSYGMTRDEVKKTMGSADRALLKMAQYSPPWNGTVDLYIYTYGPTWEHPSGWHERVFYKEWYWVYFNPQGHAVKLERSMVKGGGRDVIVDLQTQKVIAK